MHVRQFKLRWPRQDALQFLGQSTVNPSSSCAAGCLAGIALLSTCLQVLGLTGVSVPATTALCVALVAGLLGGAALPRLAIFRGTPIRLLSLGLHVALTLLLLVTPLLLTLGDRWLASHGVLQMQAGLWNIAMLCCVALPTAGLAACLSAALGTLQVEYAAAMRSFRLYPSHRAEVGSAAWYVLGVATGLLLETTAFGPLFGLFWSAIIACLVGLIVSIYQGVRRRTAESRAAGSGPTVAPIEAATYLSENREAGLKTGWREMLRSGPVLGSESAEHAPLSASTVSSAAVEGSFALLLGCLLPCLLRYVDQLAMTSVGLRSLHWSALCLGAAFGLIWASARRNPPRRWSAFWCLAVWICALPALYPSFVHAALWLNAYVEKPWLLFLARGLCAGLVLAPVGCVAGLALVQRSTTGTVGRPAHAWALRSCVCLFCVTAGCQLGIRWIVPTFGPAPAMLLLAICLAVLAAATEVRALLSSSHMVRALTAGAVALFAALPMFAPNYDPCHSARMLFGTNVFVAYRNGLEYRLLPYLDDGRNVAMTEGANGTLTAWKHGGNQIRLRENGIPNGIASADNEVFPQFTAEMLQVIYPLTLHEKPQKLLLLGLGSGLPLTTALAFPLPEIVCSEADGALVDLVRNTTMPTDASPLDDDRVQLVGLDAPLSLAALKVSFDVIVSQPGQLALRQAQSSLTREFYARAARRLSENGLFCQRIQFVDLGPDPLRNITRTLQSVFRNVMALDMAPGEILFVATNDPRGAVRPDLMSRVTTPHVRNALGWMGVDWSVMLNLPVFQNYELTRFAAEVGPRANTSTNGRLAFALPSEVARWGMKLQEVQAALAGKAERLLDSMGDEANAPELVRRLAEVQGQHELMTKYSDQWWAYRASLREQLTTQQRRSKIHQVSHTTQPTSGPPLEDRRRVAYFTALSKAITTKKISDIERLEAFELPFDPLLSYFVHQEAAELYSRAPDREFARELRHRLHTIYFASPQDPSVLCVLDALRLVCEHPEAVPAPVERWDLANSLLQTLQMRWQARTGVTPKRPDVVLGEIDESLLAAEETVDMLTALAPEAGMPAEAWDARRRVVDIGLLRPLRHYRSEILPLHLRAKKKAEAAAAAETPEAKPAVEVETPDVEPAQPAAEDTQVEPQSKPAVTQKKEEEEE